MIALYALLLHSVQIFLGFPTGVYTHTLSLSMCVYSEWCCIYCKLGVFLYTICICVYTFVKISSKAFLNVNNHAIHGHPIHGYWYMFVTLEVERKYMLCFSSLLIVMLLNANLKNYRDVNKMSTFPVVETYSRVLGDRPLM